MISNPINQDLLRGFNQHMKSIGTSDSYQNGNLKIMIYFAKFLGQDTDFYQVQKRQQILCFLDTRIKDARTNPDKKWIRTWNDYLQRIKYFFRLLYNHKERIRYIVSIRLDDSRLCPDKGKEKQTH